MTSSITGIAAFGGQAYALSALPESRNRPLRGQTPNCGPRRGSVPVHPTDTPAPPAACADHTHGGHGQAECLPKDGTLFTRFKRLTPDGRQT